MIHYTKVEVSEYQTVSLSALNPLTRAVEDSRQLGGCVIFRWQQLGEKQAENGASGKCFTGSLTTEHSDVRVTEQVMMLRCRGLPVGVHLHTRCFITWRSRGRSRKPRKRTLQHFRAQEVIQLLLPWAFGGWPSASLSGLLSAYDKIFIHCSRNSDTQSTYRHWNLAWAHSHPPHEHQQYKGIGDKIGSEIKLKLSEDRKFFY